MVFNFFPIIFLSDNQSQIDYFVMEEFIKKIPKVHLHLHLEGTIQPEMLFSFAKKNKITLPYKSLEELTNAYNKIYSLDSFLELYYIGGKVLCEEQDFYDLTFAYMKKCNDFHVKHIEPFFDPQSLVNRGIKFETALNGIYRALQDAKKEFDISSSLIMCVLRDLSEEDGIKMLKEAIKYKDKIIGIGLDSSENNNPPSKFKNLFQMAEKEGFKLCMHAGEVGDPNPYLKEALEFNLDRIDHGIRCIEDHEIIDEIVKRKLPLTVCPCSNIKLVPIDNMKNHPIKKLMDLGVVVTVNSDDPSYLGTDINENFIEVAKAHDLKEKDIVLLVNNSVDASFMSNQEKESFKNNIKQYYLKNQLKSND